MPGAAFRLLTPVGCLLVLALLTGCVAYPAGYGYGGGYYAPAPEIVLPVPIYGGYGGYRGGWGGRGR